MREVVTAASALRKAGIGKQVVLFIHGAGTPAEVAFDLDFADYSRMASLAQAAFDVFSMDMTGYGRSTRPVVMNDPCNLSSAQQRALAPQSTGCAPTHGEQMTTLASCWNDIAAVLDYLRTLRGAPADHAGGLVARRPARRRPRR